MKKLLFPAAYLTLMLLMTGCASSSSSCDPCGNTSSSWWQNRPKLFNCSRGEPCNTCNPPAGQPINCGTNVAPGCATGNCGSMVAPGPVESAPVDYYPNQMGGFPTSSTNTSGYAPTIGDYLPSNNKLAPAVGKETGSGVQLNAPLIGSNTEIERPPMYGNRNSFN